ncbi:hypothetical protein C2G38_2206444 [Gigaspora rosea]|uniref:Uncharacterized protein n=1 Tax=Gigaspora rosea TaxID=44941 RepID=A0A397ULG0_9GLOM|nr:hypothetical protein C2G38_2206444 [Gigaspora rosea]
MNLILWYTDVSADKDADVGNMDDYNELIKCGTNSNKERSSCNIYEKQLLKAKNKVANSDQKTIKTIQKKNLPITTWSKKHNNCKFEVETIMELMKKKIIEKIFEKIIDQIKNFATDDFVYYCKKDRAEIDKPSMVIFCKSDVKKDKLYMFSYYYRPDIMNNSTWVHVRECYNVIKMEYLRGS